LDVDYKIEGGRGMSAGRTNSRRWLWLFLSLVSAFSMWHYVAHIWSANQPAHFSDLYAQWWTAHEMFLHGRQPYTLEIAREIQTMIYGAPVSAMTTGDPAELSGGFAYPLYVVFLMWPTLHLPFAAVQIIFACLFLGLTLLSLLLWLKALNWSLPPSGLATLALFTLGSFPVLQGIKLQNLSLLAAFLVAATLASLVADHLILAGMLMAAATIKPQFVFLLLPWLVIWTIADWRKRRSFVWSFLATMSLLILSSEWLVPGWIPHFLEILRAYKQYTYGHSLLDVWFSPSIGPFVATAFILLAFVLCWRCRACLANSTQFLLVASFVLATTLVVIPTLAPHTQLLLLPGFLLLLRYRQSLWLSSRTSRLLLVAAWILAAWAWIAAFGLSVATIWVSDAKLLRFWMLPLYTSPLLPLGVLFVLGFILWRRSALEAS
jgi:Glycosyltransferase family 87